MYQVLPVYPFTYKFEQQQQQQQHKHNNLLLATIATSYQNEARTLGLFLHGKKRKGKSILTNRNW